MSIPTKLTFLAGFFLLLFGCINKYPGFSETGSGVYYRIHVIGDGEREPDSNDYLSINYTLLTTTDSLMTKNKQITFELGEIRDNKLREALGMLMQGDSASFIFKPEIGWQKAGIAGNHDQEIKMSLSLTKLQSPEAYAEMQKYLEWKKDQEMNEQIELKKYFEENTQLENKKYINGIYYIELERGRGERLKNGDLLFVRYKGTFLDSTEFDNTYVMKQPFDFRLGDPGQVIPGFESGIREMLEGGKAKFIIPSQLAFGERGSSQKIVPPFSTVVYEVELIKVERAAAGSKTKDTTAVVSLE